MKCSIPGCGNVRTTRLSTQQKFHVFPADQLLCNQWVEAIRNPQLPLDPTWTTVLIMTRRTHDLRVCSDHFTCEDYRGGQKSFYSTLKRGAIPTIFPWSATESENVPTTSQSHQVFPSIKVSPGSSPLHQTEPTPYVDRVVAEVCLLQLFQFCENCGFACAPRIQEEDEHCFSIIQDCKLCQYLRKWTSHPLSETNRDEPLHKNPVDTVSGIDRSCGLSLPSPEDWNFPVEEEGSGNERCSDAETQNFDDCGHPDSLRMEDPFVCEVCQRSFTQLMFLTSHMWVHTRETPFKCQQCDQCFKHRASLTYHVKKSHISDVNSKERERQGFRIQFNRETGGDPDFKPAKKKRKKSTTEWSLVVGHTEEQLKSQQANMGTEAETFEVNQTKEKNCDGKEEEREGHPDGHMNQERGSEVYPGGVFKEEEWGDGYCPNIRKTETFMVNTVDIKTEEQEASLEPPRAQERAESQSNSEGKQEEERGATRRTTGRMKKKLMDSANFEYY